MSEVPPLVAEAMKKAGLVWIATAGERPNPAWHVWSDGAMYVLTGPGEQPLPGLTSADRCAVTVPSSDKGGRIVTWAGAVSRVDPASETWTQVVPLLHAVRLNLSDGESAEQRWAAECAVLRVEPTGELIEGGATLPDSSGAAPPRPTSATSRVPIPYTLGRRTRRSGGRRG